MLRDNKATSSPSKFDLQIQPYIDAGLTRPFAEAIVKGTDYDEVLDLWEQDWWKQYDDNDPLLLAVLSGQVTQENGKWLNDIRSDHQNLVMMYLQGDVTFEWAQALMETSFSDDPEAVEYVLRGAIPEVIARMRNLDNSGGNFPPQLSVSSNKQMPSFPGQPGNLGVSDCTKVAPRSPPPAPPGFPGIPPGIPPFSQMPGQLSDDGQWKWNGHKWEPVLDPNAALGPNAAFEGLGSLFG